MATIEELERALIKADEAGDTESAQALADEIRMMLGETDKPSVVSFGEQVMDVPRQVGLTARSALRGALGITDVLGAPVRSLTEQILGRQVAPLSETVPAALGLPEPQTPTERVVGDVASAMTGGGLVSGAARLARPAADVGRRIAGVLAESPVTQMIASGVGAGTAGAVREAGGGPVAQTLAGLTTGLGTAAVAPAATRLGGAVGERVSNIGRVSPREISIDVRIENALRPSGVRFQDLSPSLRESLRQDIAQATQTGDLSPAAVTRLVDYRLTGATPTRATLTLNPAEVTRQKNIARQGANLSDPDAQVLANIENQNNQILLGRMNQLGAENALDPIDAGRRIISNISSIADEQQANINALYSAAKTSGGRSANLDGFEFTQLAGRNLDEKNLGAFLPKEFKRTLNQISQGKVPLTVDVAEQIKTQLATAQRSASDGNVRSALGAVRDALENTPLQSGQNLGKEAIDAFNAARAANRQFKQLQEQNPFLKKVVEGVEPDKFFEQQVIGQSANSVKKLVQFLGPEERQVLKNQMVDYIKNRATGGVPDDTARLSGIKMSQVLKSIGKDKLEAIFTKDEIAQLRAISNVARYEQVLPVGSAVNVSNTAAAAAGIIDRLARSSLLGKIPLGAEIVGTPARNIIVGRQARQAVSVPEALTMEQLRGRTSIQPPLGLLFQERD